MKPTMPRRVAALEARTAERMTIVFVSKGRARDEITAVTAAGRRFDRKPGESMHELVSRVEAPPFALLAAVYD